MGPDPTELASFSEEKIRACREDRAPCTQEHQVRTQPEAAMCTQGRGLERYQPCPRPDPGLPAYRTVRT